MDARVRIEEKKVETEVTHPSVNRERRFEKFVCLQDRNARRALRRAEVVSFLARRMREVLLG